MKPVTCSACRERIGLGERRTRLQKIVMSGTSLSVTDRYYHTHHDAISRKRVAEDPGVWRTAVMEPDAEASTEEGS